MAFLWLINRGFTNWDDPPSMSSVQGCHGFFTHKRNLATPSWCWPFSPAANHEKYVFKPTCWYFSLHFRNKNWQKVVKLTTLNLWDQQTNRPPPLSPGVPGGLLDPFSTPVFRIFGVVVTSPCGGEGNSECTKSKTFSFALLVWWEFKVTPPPAKATPPKK